MPREPQPYLIVVQGAPGVGKTTLARRLAADLVIDCVAKDDLKEALYELYGAPDTSEQTKLFGRIAIRSMYIAADEYLRMGRTVMIEAPLEARFAVEDIAQIARNEQVIQLHVSCDPEVQAERFRARLLSGERHAGHLDTIEFTVDDARASQERNAPLPGMTTILIDTTHLTEAAYQTIRSRIKEELS